MVLAGEQILIPLSICLYIALEAIAVCLDPNTIIHHPSIYNAVKYVVYGLNGVDVATTVHACRCCMLIKQFMLEQN